MSDATLCTDTHLDRLVVVKSIKTGVDERRILDELSALQAIRSKHVVQIYDIIRTDVGAVTGIVEEYLPGRDLTEVPAPTTADEFLRLVFPIAEGIADIHGHGIVHRDLKRQNMKYDGEACLKIFDFGLSRIEAADAKTIGSIGTPGYMAPELYERTKGGTVSFTRAVDVYAFGATTLALVLGKLPKELRAHPPKHPSPLTNFSALSLGLPPDVSEILEKCFNVEPERRPGMDEISRVIGLHLLRDRHRALLVSRGRTYVLDHTNRIVQLSVTNQGALTIEYDGLRFVLSGVSGAVAVNNLPVSNGDVLPGSCVIVFGTADLGTRRTMITVDVSHPEVAL
jgi:serine/threonine protein kinase